MASTTGMKPGGYYDSHSDAQRVAIDAFLPWLRDAVADLPTADAPLYLLDLGSSQGRNAIHAMRCVVESLPAAPPPPHASSSVTCPPMISTNSSRTSLLPARRHSPI